MTGSVTLRRSRRWPRAVLVVPLLSALILVLGWSVLWAVARQQAGAGFDRWIDAEAAHGRVWTCPDRSVEGYPFRIALSCRDVAFQGVVDGSPGAGHLAGLSAWTWVYEPNSVYVVLDGPLSLTTDDGRADFTLAWGRLGAKLRGLFGERRRVELVGEDLALTRRDAAVGTVRRVEMHAGPAVAAANIAAADADAVTIALKGVTWPALDVASGDGAPLDATFSGVVTRAFGDLPDFGPATVERWRRSGGRLDVSNLALAKGPLSLGAAGTLGLDDLHRLTGRLDASLGGFEPLAKRFGVSLRAVAVGGLLANLLGPKPAGVSTGAVALPSAVPPGAVTLPVLFADGTVAMGPINTGLRLTPLY